MFIGHHAIGFAAKPLTPNTSLAALIAAPILLDLLWPIFVLAGIESFRIVPGTTAVTPLAFDHYPWSHSLLMSIVWAALFGGAYWIVARNRRGAIVLAMLVVSHWLFDAIVHVPDLPLMPGSEVEIGLGLWRSVAGTFALEIAIFAAGVWLYLKSTERRDRIGAIALWAFVAFDLIVYLGNVFGPPPPSERAVAWVALLALLFPMWGAWIDRHRRAIS